MINSRRGLVRDPRSLGPERLGAGKVNGAELAVTLYTN